MIDQFITLKGNRKICYIECGDREGFPLFFFHGWPGSRFQGKGLDHVARKLHIRIIVPDRPGFGQSDFYPDRTLLDWPDDVVELADKLKIDTFSVLGNSGGGPYAAVCAYKIPERVHKAGISVGLSPTNIQGVLQGMAFHNQAIWFLYHYVPILTKLNSLGFYWRDKISPRSFFGTFSSNADRNMLNSTIKNRIITNRKEAFRQGIKGASQDLEIYIKDWGFSLEEIKSQVYLWYGMLDKNVSVKMGEYYNKHIPNSELIIYPDVGHLLLFKYAEDILKKLIS